MSRLQLFVDSQYAGPWALACFVVLQEKSVAAEWLTGAAETAAFGPLKTGVFNVADIAIMGGLFGFLFISRKGAGVKKAISLTNLTAYLCERLSQLFIW